jgi:hypothetical protein
MPRPRKWYDAATKQAAYRMRKDKERLALGAAILDLMRAVREAQGHGPAQVALNHIPTDDPARLIREVALAISAGTKGAMAESGCYKAEGAT